ncbi:hypothetical protein CORC01_10303 [Colletotrichum orchidophilum]|uniref:BTB domain-containing protein n=1 Tax=Colletotrichum orchidophilum TaxID=1209926 RepID=A0A1G4AZ52_9PEZI|nr:uncharacterized protein CORC01_10303 [Colletotrichum orchidophilum]OHE94375.1 hypothetical protein CORC01_10303 [Colletotrichum orchidophilum]
MSNESFHRIDPNGDVVLILRNPSASFAVWDTDIPAGENVLKTTADPGTSLSDNISTLQAPLIEDDVFAWPTRLKSELNGIKGKKKKKKMMMMMNHDEAALTTAETPLQDTDEVSIAEPSAAGPSGSIGYQWSLTSEAIESIPVEEAYPEPMPEPYEEPVLEAYEEPPPEPMPEPAAEAYEEPPPEPYADAVPESYEEPAPETYEEAPPEACEELVVKYLVSSRHLALASRYFSAKLSGPWIEASVKHLDGCYHMEATDWDSKALLILMQVIHGKTRSVPRLVNLEMLAKLAVLIDYYDCHEVIEIYIPRWINPLKINLPTNIGRDMVLWLLIAQVFQQDDIFQQMTQIAVLQTTDPVQTLELPVPSFVVDMIDWRRQDGVEFILTVLHNLLDAFRNETAGCSFECSSILLGALTKEMDKHKLFHPRPTKPYSGYSVANLETLVRAFRSPKWNAFPSYNRHSTQHSCNLQSMISCYLNADFDKSKKGFKLYEMVLRDVKGKANGHQWSEASFRRSYTLRKF